MSDIKHVYIRCDVPYCLDEFIGEAGENASTLRKRIAGQKYGGWVSKWKSLPRTAFMIGHDIPARRERVDYCPFHASKIEDD